MTRHQVWKARERARFRWLAAVAAFNKRPSRATHRELESVHIRYKTVCAISAQRGIKEPFLG